MSSHYARPRWWQLYLTFPLLIALFMLDHRLVISERGHQSVQIGILVVIFGLVHLWLKANSTALSEVDRVRSGGTVRLIRFRSHELPDESRKHPMLGLPDSEINGTLSDTFEMDYIDAEFFPVDEVPQDMKKE